MSKDEQLKPRMSPAEQISNATRNKLLLKFSEAEQALTIMRDHELPMMVIIVDDNGESVALAQITGGINNKPSETAETDVIGVTIIAAVDGASTKRTPTGVELFGEDKAFFSITQDQRPGVMSKYVRVIV